MSDEYKHKVTQEAAEAIPICSVLTSNVSRLPPQWGHLLSILLSFHFMLLFYELTSRNETLLTTTVQSYSPSIFRDQRMMQVLVPHLPWQWILRHRLKHLQIALTETLKVFLKLMVACNIYFTAKLF